MKCLTTFQKMDNLSCNVRPPKLHFGANKLKLYKGPQNMIAMVISTQNNNNNNQDLLAK